MTEQQPTQPFWRRVSPRWRRHVWWCATALLLLLALYIVLARQLMSMLPEFRDTVQSHLASALDMPVTIGKFHGHMDGMNPVFVFDDVALSPADDDAAPLTLRRVEISVAPLDSLLARGLRLRQLWISGVDLHLVRDEEGAIRFRGLEAFEQDQLDAVDSLSEVLDHVYRQQRIVLDDVSARFDWPGLPPLRTDDLTLALVREEGEHRLAVTLSATDRPLELDVRLRLRGTAYSLEELDGSAYVRVRGENLEYWLPEDWPLPLKPETASGQVEAWAVLRRGDVQQANVVLATRDVALRHVQADERWLLDGLEASLAVRRERGEYVVVLDEVSASTEAAGALRAGPLALRWDGRRRADSRWAVRAEQINATRLREQLVAWPFPLPENLLALRQRLVDLAPAGELSAVHVEGEGARLARFSARFVDLAISADEAQPGVQGLSGWAAGTPASGVLHLASPALVLELNTLFDEPVAASMGGAMRWQRDSGSAAQERRAGMLPMPGVTETHEDTEADQGEVPVWHIESGRLQASNADARGAAVFGLDLAAGYRPRLRLLADIHDGVAAQASRYIPLQRMPPALSDWFGHAFSGGQVTRGRFLYEGAVGIDPARQQDRTFQMTFAVEDFGLRFLTDWPEVEAVQGTVLVDGVTVHGRHLRGRFLDAEIRDADVDVLGTEPDGQPRLTVTANIDGPLAALQRLFQGTPVRAQLPEEIVDWTVRNGTLAGRLELGIPLAAHSPALRVEADAAVDAGTLHNPDRRLMVSDVQGEGRFSLEDGLHFPTLRGRLFDTPVSASVTSDRRYTHLDIDGALTMTQLRDWLRMPWLTPLDGETDYRARLRLPRRAGAGAPRLTVNTDLQGVAVALPPPLGKTASTSRRLQLILEGGDPGRLSLTIPALLSARLEYDDTGLTRGGIRFGEREAGLPPSGVLVDGRTEVLDLGAWVGVLLGPDTDGPATPLPPVRLALDTDQLLLLNEPLGPASFSARQTGGHWSLALASEPLVGEVRVPAGYAPRGDQPMQLDIDRLRWPLTAPLPPDADGPSAAQRVVEAAAELAGDQTGELVSSLVLSPDPSRMPVADIRAADVTLYGRHFGQWQAQLRPEGEDLRVAGVRGRWGETSVAGDLDWRLDDVGAQHSRFAGSVESGQLADLLSLFAMETFVESRDARGSLELGWQGSPLEFDYRRLQGDVSLDVRDALLPSADRRTSALRLLGLVNVGNTLARRLRLDFSDVVSQGLVADSIRGNFSVDGPQIHTDNLRIRSPSAEFAIAGGLDLQAQTMDYDIEVTLPLSGNLYAGCLAGPAACAGIFVVERLWGERLEKMTSMGYHVSGSWDEPDVEETESALPTPE
ncbi:YhdP family protein [Isoalcanivorax indicus]|uniref:YhdP family phospholipid transporter n=1 Tax=Isoalcanivorax indicus TaxID=2202653 RepID=UPI000DB99F0A|nr:AsmA-like C-terminal region-containing protein [Isoalcanivorax indicus]